MPPHAHRRVWREEGTQTFIPGCKTELNASLRGDNWRQHDGFGALASALPAVILQD